MSKKLNIINNPTIIPIPEIKEALKKGTMFFVDRILAATIKLVWPNEDTKASSINEEGNKLVWLSIIFSDQLPMNNKPKPPRKYVRIKMYWPFT